jgi:GT2 family glycosyltransferase
VSLRRTLLTAARKLLPRSAKRFLKRFWDPHQLLPPPSELLAEGFGWLPVPSTAEDLPATSVVVVTFGALPYTRLCLETLLRSSGLPQLEVIVVDNASTDGTPAYLTELAERDRRVQVILNDRNEGFPAAVNRGLLLTTGEALVLLNNDVVVPAGSLPHLLRHLDAGLVVAATNASANESRVEASYSTLAAMQQFADARARDFAGQRFDLPTAAMYCVALRRELWERVGPLDERFTVGTFEDDDYSERVRRTGSRVVCAADAFVHHFGSATFRHLPGSEYFALMERNRRLYAEKWGE